MKLKSMRSAITVLPLVLVAGLIGCAAPSEGSDDSTVEVGVATGSAAPQALNAPLYGQEPLPGRPSRTADGRQIYYYVEQVKVLSSFLIWKNTVETPYLGYTQDSTLIVGYEAFATKWTVQSWGTGVTYRLRAVIVPAGVPRPLDVDLSAPAVK